MSKESTEILFDSLLALGDVKITDVHEKRYIVYFKANGHQFCCAAGKVYHEKSVMYGTPILDVWAKIEKDPVEIVRNENRDKDFNTKWDGWQKYEDEIIKKVFNEMLPHILLNDMDKAKAVFEFYFDHILPGKGAEKLVKKLIKKDGAKK